MFWSDKNTKQRQKVLSWYLFSDYFNQNNLIENYYVACMCVCMDM